MSLLTIIVPILNSENTLKKCLMSLKDQIFKDFIVEMIDNGSSDNSSIICKKFEKDDARFRYFRYYKKGVSNVRNFGLSRVKTPFVTFVDSDDWVDSTHLENLIRGIVHTDVCSVEWTRQDEILGDSDKTTFKIISQRDYIRKALGMKEISGFSCNKIFKMSIIENHNIRFANVFFSEDLLFVLEYLNYVRTGSLVLGPKTYHYIINDESITNSTKPDTLFAEIDSSKLIKHKIKDIDNHIPDVKAHMVNVYKNTFIKILTSSLNTHSNQFIEIKKNLRSKMRKNLVAYCMSREFSLYSKVLVITLIFIPRLFMIMRYIKKHQYRRKS